MPIDTSTVTAALFSTLDFQPSGSPFSARLEASQELLIAAFLWDCCGIVQESVQRVGRMLQKLRPSRSANAASCRPNFSSNFRADSE